MYNAQMNSQPPQDTIGRTGRVMIIAAWVLILILLTLFFSQWQSRERNPNRDPESRLVNGTREVVLQRNRFGHYVASGTINGAPVTFLLDTGATQISIPGDLAGKLGLQPGPAFSVSTANGTITVRGTRLDTLALGPIRLHDVRANINPYMDGDEVLLGMNALRNLDFSQRGDRLTLRQFPE